MYLVESTFLEDVDFAIVEPHGALVTNLPLYMTEINIVLIIRRTILPNIHIPLHFVEVDGKTLRVCCCLLIYCIKLKLYSQFNKGAPAKLVGTHEKAIMSVVLEEGDVGVQSTTCTNHLVS